MSGAPVEIRPTIDRTWLESAAREEPLLHAYALWDLDQHPGRVRFFSALRGSTTLGYLLLWPLGDGGTIVHWLGDPESTSGLLGVLPPRPLVILCSEAGAPLAERARGPATVRPVLAEVAPVGSPPPVGPHDEMVRRLTGDERTIVREFAGRQTERIGAAYSGIDPAMEPVWGGFEGGRLVALARPAVRLPHLWVVGGVYVDPDHRNQGWGRSVVRAVMGEAARAGAPCGLFVREDGAPARAMYAGLGYRPVGRRLWIDAGCGRDP
ncbi:MAG: GNAT family N-acetyltransferase [Thermoplasmata archaeon]|nr:GNAT family N-acetyltransferase [Thermoplasmata archaeon]